MHTVWYTAMSMDGRIAGPSDNLEFLSSIELGPEANREFEEFMSTIDAVLVGANTLRWLLEQGEDFPLSGKPIWALTTDERLKERLIGFVRDDTPIHVAKGQIESVLKEIEAERLRRVWICGGGSVAGQVLAADRLDVVRKHVVPINQ